MNTQLFKTPVDGQNAPSSDQHSAAPQLLTVKQFCLTHPAFTASSLRNLIFNAAPRHSSKGKIPGNGLLDCGAILRLGRKILIDERAFFAWVRGKANAAGSDQVAQISAACTKATRNGGN